jgi:hypothetical protein
MSIAFVKKEVHFAALPIFVFEGFVGVTNSVSVEGLGPSFLESLSVSSSGSPSRCLRKTADVSVGHRARSNVKVCQLLHKYKESRIEAHVAAMAILIIVQLEFEINFFFMLEFKMERSVLKVLEFFNGKVLNCGKLWWKLQCLRMCSSVWVVLRLQDG